MRSQSHVPQAPALGTLRVCVADQRGSHARGANALIKVYRWDAAKTGVAFDANWASSNCDLETEGRTMDDGCLSFEGLPPGDFVVLYDHYPPTPAQLATVRAGCTTEVCLTPDTNIRVNAKFVGANCEPVRCDRPRARDGISLEYEVDELRKHPDRGFIIPPPGYGTVPGDPLKIVGRVHRNGPFAVDTQVAFRRIGAAPGPDDLADAARFPSRYENEADDEPVQQIGGQIGVTLQRTATQPTEDTAFFRALLNSTEGLSFNTYLRFMDNLFCEEPIPPDLPQFEQDRFAKKTRTFREPGGLRDRRLLPFTDADAYRVIKAATEAFVMVNCGVLTEPRPFDRPRDGDYLQRRDLPAQDLPAVFTRYLEPIQGGTSQTLPYLAVIRSKLPDIAIKLAPIEDAELLSKCTGILQDKLANPCLLELIWSYWHEEGMLVQTMNAITRRFQNVRAHERDPLANLEIDPLRPLNNVLWGFVQDEQHRLSVVRRNYEYDHHYGLRLEGKAVARMRTADSRSRFLEAFHHLLRLCAVFYKQDDDTTVKADAFPVLNALKEVHLILSQGAHNQFGDLPSTARIEMLMTQWMLARPEFREFLPTRIMTAYPEPWMDRVDAMKKLQGWSDASVLHFRNLAIFGEQVLLTIRWGHWSDVQEPLQAFNWARLLRPQVQGYSHAYRAVTGVDLSIDVSDRKVDATLPSVLLQRRLATQQRTA